MKGSQDMDKKEQRVREAARHLHTCDERVKHLGMTNTPTDPDERMAAFEALEMARAEAMKAYMALLRAKSDYAQ